VVICTLLAGARVLIAQTGGIASQLLVAVIAAVAGGGVTLFVTRSNQAEQIRQESAFDNRKYIMWTLLPQLRALLPAYEANPASQDHRIADLLSQLLSYSQAIGGEEQALALQALQVWTALQQTIHREGEFRTEQVLMPQPVLRWYGNVQKLSTLQGQFRSEIAALENRMATKMRP
jgi:hypothetical protein